MDLSNLANYNIFAFPILPIAIFFARIVDVSIGTIRLILLARGSRIIVPILGFFEVLIWLTAVSQVVRNLTTPILLAAYAGGYAAGNYVGIILENRLRLGTVILRIITKSDASRVIGILRSENYGVTKVEAEGSQGLVHLIFMVVKRKDLPRVISLVQDFHPHAFFTVEDVREVHEGVFPPAQRARRLVGPQRK